MVKFKSAATALAMAVFLMGSQATAANGPLPAPGKPSGVQAAQRGSRHLLLIGSAVVVMMITGIAIGVLTSNNAQCGNACTVTSPGT